MISPLTTKALRMLEGDPAILNVARRVSRVLEETQIAGAVIGGMAVVLHGHLRTTRDVDVWTENTATLGEALTAAGFQLDADERQFVLDDVPVHLVTTEQVGTPPRHLQVLEGVTTVSLADLVSIKLRSGVRSVRRSRDLADVVDLIQSRQLTAAFAAKLASDVRAEFRRLVKAIAADA